MMGSFDAGYGTWYLEDLIGKKRAKDLWFRNPKVSSQGSTGNGAHQQGCTGR
jgi:naphthoate synthase